MNYSVDKHGNKISTLGFGCMRFSKTMGIINMKEAESQIMEAYRLGVNYFDTAYIYPGNESALGQIVEKNGIRNNIYISTKFPHYLIRSVEALEKMFNEQLKRLRTDYIDVYLVHMLTDISTWNKLVDMGVLHWLENKKKEGKIKQIGFSYHGNTDMFCQLVDAYDWDTCIVQYNYMDEHTQAGRKGIKHASSKGISVVIMEPLRGGNLVNKLPAEAKKIFADSPKNYTPAQWAFKWLWNQPEITCVLSGMNSMEMILENTNTASTTFHGDLTEADQSMLEEVSNAINEKMKIKCTGCGYCVPCPKGVDIPGAFASYNRRFTEGKAGAFMDYIKCTAAKKDATSASNCINCGKCQKHCPQGIQIPIELTKVAKEFENPIYKIARKFFKKSM